jgi:hypothetical protein
LRIPIPHVKARIKKNLLRLPDRIDGSMTLESLYRAIADNSFPIILLMLATPWVSYLLCYAIPGRKEEPFVLSVNLAISVVSVLMLIGYLAYALNTGGIQTVVKQANVFLLLLPAYHLIVSIWLARLRVPLEVIPAFRTLQGLVLMGAVYLALSWVMGRVYIIFFSYLPLSTFLFILALLLGIGYLGFRRVFG